MSQSLGGLDKFIVVRSVSSDLCQWQYEHRNKLYQYENISCSYIKTAMQLYNVMLVCGKSPMYHRVGRLCR